MDEDSMRDEESEGTAARRAEAMRRGTIIPPKDRKDSDDELAAGLAQMGIAPGTVVKGDDPSTWPQGRERGVKEGKRKPVWPEERRGGIPKRYSDEDEDRGWRSICEVPFECMRLSRRELDAVVPDDPFGCFLWGDGLGSELISVAEVRLPTRERQRTKRACPKFL